MQATQPNTNSNSPAAQLFGKRLIVAAAVILVVVILFALVWWGGAAGLGSGKTRGAQSWFTADDGKTWFADDLNKLPPFEKNGRTVSRVYLFSCDGGKTVFVGYLERFTPEGKRALQTILNSKSAP